MSWTDDAEKELTRAREAKKLGNEGRVRVSARRAVSIMVNELQKRVTGKNYGSDAVRQLQALAEDVGFPQEVRNAAGRLQARLSTDFASESKDPIADALIIIECIRLRLSE
ncbi:MAG: hypothetical protein HY088_03310 [Ignavibacteriales bacterium]|nr:hypothetical protein [Ignavibacteriales bacterium]